MGGHGYDRFGVFQFNTTPGDTSLHKFGRTQGAVGSGACTPDTATVRSHDTFCCRLRVRTPINNVLTFLPTRVASCCASFRSVV